MTYLQFHLLFLVPPLALMAAAVKVRGVRAGDRRARWALPVLAGIALVYTTPWDNYLVARGVWRYGADRVIGTIGYVPIEEYLFFLLQPFLVGFWFLLLPEDTRGDEDDRGVPRLVTLYLVLAAAGAFLLRYDASTYLGLILVWACPVLAGQAAFAGRALRRHRRRIIIALAVPVLYLWCADAIAIRLGIWEISARFTTGATLLGLPVEEATFFLLTSLLLVQGLVLFLHPGRRSRNSAPAAMVGSDA